MFFRQLRWNHRCSTLEQSAERFWLSLTDVCLCAPQPSTDNSHTFCFYCVVLPQMLLWRYAMRRGGVYLARQDFPLGGLPLLLPFRLHRSKAGMNIFIHTLVLCMSTRIPGSPLLPHCRHRLTTSAGQHPVEAAKRHTHAHQNTYVNCRLVTREVSWRRHVRIIGSH